jgi:uncharacterized protein (DUF1015 family)
MARIFPFRGIRYDLEAVGDIARVVAQPYDKIDSRLQELYYRRHPSNIVRIIKGKTFSEDNEQENQYTRARGFLNDWLQKRILQQDRVPTLYIYDESYRLPSGDDRQRRGLIALAELEELGKGGVIPHERTLAGPKADRLKLMQATGAQFGQIFMLYSDPENKINRFLDRGTADPPLYDFRDDSEGEGVNHRLWAVTQPEVVQGVVGEMADKSLFIADGHHRYETALNFRNEMREKGIKCREGSENYNNRMVTFVNFEDEGLTILPTHRAIHSLKNFNPASFFSRLREYFDLREIRSLESLLARIREGKAGHVFGLYDGNQYFLIGLKPGEKPETIIPGKHSPAWKNLDVAILHTLILDHLLGIGAKELEAHTNVRYYRSAREAEEQAKSGQAQLVFFLNPTRASQVKEVAGEGDKMPPKSTDFFPKILTGLVMNKINFK